MLKIKKILETICVFLLTMLSICFLFSLFSLFQSHISFQELLGKTGLYFLYTIGYGALEGDAFIQNILAIIGIVSLALMSTFLTIHLFWRLDDVKFHKKILFDGKDTLTFEFLNKGRTICDMKAVFMIHEVSSMESILQKEFYLPILFQKSKWKLKMNLKESFWYQAIYNLYRDQNRKLYCMYSFVDTKNGQGSIQVEEIKKEYMDPSFSFEYFTKPICFSEFSLASSEDVSIVRNQNNYQIHFDEKSHLKDFAMVYLNFHYDKYDFQKYGENAYFEMTLSSSKEMNLTLQIKSERGIFEKEYLLQSKMQTFSLFLKEIPFLLDQVNEICFTIFKEKNKNENTLKIQKFELHREETEI